MHGPVKACLLDEKEKLWQGRATWMGFPGDVNGKEPTCQCRKRKKLRLSLDWEDPVEEGMAAHSRVLAWRSPWTEEPGGLQSIGSQRVRQD